MHKELLSEISDQCQSSSSRPNAINNQLHTQQCNANESVLWNRETEEFDCDSESAEKLSGRVLCNLCKNNKKLQFPNEIKIHMARSHPEEKDCSNFSHFGKLISKYKMETKIIKRIPRRC